MKPLCLLNNGHGAEYMCRRERHYLGDQESQPVHGEHG